MLLKGRALIFTLSWTQVIIAEIERLYMSVSHGSRHFAADFVRDVALRTGVILDPVYTGKAAAGMLAEMDTNPTRFKGRRVLFIHTGPLSSLLCVCARRVCACVRANKPQKMHNIVIVVHIHHSPDCMKV